MSWRKSVQPWLGVFWVSADYHSFIVWLIACVGPDESLKKACEHLKTTIINFTAALFVAARIAPSSAMLLHEVLILTRTSVASIQASLDAVVSK